MGNIYKPYRSIAASQKGTNKIPYLHLHPLAWFQKLYSTPAKRDSSGSISTLLDKGFVELTTRTWMNLSPAVLTVILQTCHIGTKERSKFASTSWAMAFITHLVIQNIGLHFHLQYKSANHIWSVLCEILLKIKHGMQMINIWKTPKSIQIFFLLLSISFCWHSNIILTKENIYVKEMLTQI